MKGVLEMRCIRKSSRTARRKRIEGYVGKSIDSKKQVRGVRAFWGVAYHEQEVYLREGSACT